jgi:hypothetical protein
MIITSLLIGAQTSIVAASGLLALSMLALWIHKSRAGAQWGFRLHFHPNHVVQPLTQGAVYVYLSLNSPWIGRYLPLILYQLVFAFVFEMILSLAKYRCFRVGFSVFPIVLSLNLVLWFRPEYFYLQLAMVALAVFSKHFLLRDDGRHIFNPSGLALAAATLFLFCIRFKFIYLVEIIDTYRASRPGIFLLLLTVGWVPQLAGGVSLISLGALLSLCSLYTVSDWVTGLPLINRWVDPAILVGVTLLATDPATTPRNRWPRFVFGLLYGAGIIFWYGLLSYLYLPGYFAKILALPLLNVITPRLDKLGDPTRGAFTRLFATTRIQTAVYSAVFLLLVPRAAQKRRPSLPATFNSKIWAEGAKR